MPELSQMVETLGDNGILFVPVALILAFLGYAVLKRLLKLALFLLVFAGAYAGLLYYFG